MTMRSLRADPSLQLPRDSPRGGSFDLANTGTRLCLSVLLAASTFLLAGCPANRNSSGEIVGTGDTPEERLKVGEPHVALSETGDGIIVFAAEAAAGGTTILAALYDPAIGLGGTAAVSTDNSSSPANLDDEPRVAVDGAGRAMVVWKQRRPGAVSFVSRLHDPVAGWGDTQEIDDARNTTAVFDGAGRTLAMDRAGNALLVWAQSTEPLGVLPGVVVAARRPAGGSWSAPQVISQAPGGSGFARPRQVALAMNADGIAVVAVAWAAEFLTPVEGGFLFSQQQLWAQSFDPVNGFGVEQRVDTEPGILDHNAAIDAAGNVIAVWSDVSLDDVFGGDRLRTRRYIMGSGWEPEVSTLASDVHSQRTRTPAVALDVADNGMALYVNRRAELVAIPFREGQWLLGHLVTVPDAAVVAEEGAGVFRHNGYDLSMTAAGDATLIFAQRLPEEDSLDPRRIAYRRFYSNAFDPDAIGSGWQERRFIDSPNAGLDSTLPVVAMQSRASALASWLSGGDAATFTNREQVRAMAWRAPTAEFSIAAERLDVSFNGGASRANSTDGALTRYSWDFEDDGIFDTDGPASSANHRYPIDGTYTARLRVTDTDGVTGETTRTVTVSGGVSAARRLDVRISNDGDGRVTSQPAGIDCRRAAGNTTNCTHNFADGSVIQLIATPDAGFTLSEWRGDPDCVDGQVTLDGNRQCEAVFASDAATFFLQFSPNSIVGPGHVETDDLRIVCPQGDCATSYVNGALVRVRAVPDAGAQLEAWTGDCETFAATPSPIEFVINRNISCGAVFATVGP